MGQKYKSTWWSVELPAYWKAESEEDCVTLSSEYGVGTLQISAYRHNAENVTDEDLFDFAEDELVEGVSLHNISFGDFIGIEISYFSGESFWRKLWLRSGSLLLYVTYNCITEESIIEAQDINLILASISIK